MPQRAGQGLTDTYGHAGFVSEVFDRRDAVDTNGVLVPKRVELLEGLGDLESRRKAPQRVKLDHDVHLRADG